MKEVTLSDGRIATIAPGKGKHANEAMKISNGKGEEYLVCLMAQLITIDGKGIVKEDLEEMPLKDFTVLQTEFADVNF